ncbi:MAG: HK97 family phage prohead protease [Candidatus Anammoxibacter sp.]
MKTEQKFLNSKLLIDYKFNHDDDDVFFFEGHAAIFDNVDRGNDIIKKGAFKKTIVDLKKNSVEIVGAGMVKLMPIFWGHDSNKPVGSFVEMKEDDRGLFVKGRLTKNSVFVNSEVIPAIKDSTVSDLSIGFKTVESSFSKEGVRMLEELSLFEASLVSLPMNLEANITKKEFEFIESLAVLNRDSDLNVKDFTLDTENLSDEQITQCMSYGYEGKSLANVIDGNVTIVPDSVFHAAAYIHAKDIQGVARNNIEYCYKRMNLNNPFKETNAFRIDDFKSHTKRELESLLKSGVTFSGSMAKRIISALSDKSQRDAGQKSCQRDAELKDELKRLLKSFN